MRKYTMSHNGSPSVPSALSLSPPLRARCLAEENTWGWGMGLHLALGPQCGFSWDTYQRETSSVLLFLKSTWALKVFRVDSARASLPADKEECPISKH